MNLHTRVAKGTGARAAALTMAFKLLKAAQRTWCRFDAHDLLPLVHVGVVFKIGSPGNDRSTEQKRTLEGSPLDHPNPQLLTLSHGFLKNGMFLQQTGIDRHP